MRVVCGFGYKLGERIRKNIAVGIKEDKRWGIQDAVCHVNGKSAIVKECAQCGYIQADIERSK